MYFKAWPLQIMELPNSVVAFCLSLAYCFIPGGSGCVSGWVKERAGCYRLFNVTRTWHQASSECVQSSGYQAALVTLNDLTEQTFVLQMRPDDSDQIHWIGYFRNGTDWKWSDELETGIVHLDKRNITQDTGCAAITRKGSWLPTSCNVMLPFFCEYHERGVVPHPKLTSKRPITSGPFSMTTPLTSGSQVTTSGDKVSFAKCFRLHPSSEKDSCLQGLIQANDKLCSQRPLNVSDVDMTHEDRVRLMQNYITVINDNINESMSFPSCNNPQLDGVKVIEGISDIQWLRPEDMPFSSWNTELEVLFTRLSPEAAQNGPIFEGIRTGCIVQSVRGPSTDTSAADLQLSIIVTATTPHLVLLKESGPEYQTYVSSSVLTMSVFQAGNKTSVGHTFTMFYNHLDDWIDPTQHRNESSTSLHCAYYVVSLRVWSTWGCTIQSQDRYTVTCSCNHTTSFAVLVKVRTFDLPKEHQLALNVITYIGCSVSMVTLFMALTIFTCVRALDSERVYVHRHLCLALLASQVVFLAGIQATANKIVCQVVAMFLHYCFTAVFTWMLVEGLHLYAQVIQVFANNRSRSGYYLVFGWGIPVVAVVVGAAANIDGYGTRKCCWLSTETGVIWAFIGPVVAIITVNTVILVMVIHVVVGSVGVDVESRTRLQARAALKGMASLLPLLGLTWIFGILAINKDLIIFEYLFALFNSLQGFFVFIFHCVRNTEVRQALSRLRERHSLTGSGDQRESCPPSCHSMASTVYLFDKPVYLKL